jgi:hypothetical protein
MAAKKRFRDFNLNDNITVEINVADALNAVDAYMHTEWRHSSVEAIMLLIYELIMDPVELKERQAAVAAQQEQQQAILQHQYGNIQTPFQPPWLNPGQSSE